MTPPRLHSLTWLVWGIAAMAPLLLGRNPLMVVQLAIIVIATHLAWERYARMTSWRWVIRLALVLVPITTLLNALTVRAGNTVIATLPENWPIIGGDVTANALVYGIVNGVALLVLILIGVTAASMLDWNELVRILPDRLAPIAVAGTVAWAFLPQIPATFRDIRESQIARGQPIASVRTFPLLIVPILAGGLERAMTFAEVLEVRGFGAPSAAPTPTPLRRTMFSHGSTIVALLSLFGTIVLLATGHGPWALPAFTLGMGCLFIAFRSMPATAATRTQFRPTVWTRDDRITTIAALLSVGVVAWRLVANPSALQFSPYPDLTVPPTDMLLLLGLNLLLAPTVIAAWRSSG